MDRLRVATVWLGGCAGCHMSFLDLDEWLVELAQHIEVVYSPIMDVKEYPHDVDLCLIEGALANEENLEMLHKVRERTKCLVSFGDCAVTGNVTAMRNWLKSPQDALIRAYIENADVKPQLPAAKGILPALLPRVMPLHEAVRVDYFLPGCPPPAGRIKLLLQDLLGNKAPSLAGENIRFG